MKPGDAAPRPDAPAAPDLTWLDDGSPYSPRFDERYHSHHDGGLAQARGSFLHGCDLPAAWAQRPQWRVLETGFGLGLNFLATWQAWRDDPQRCARLHFISTEAYPVSAQALLEAARQRYPELEPLAQQLAAQYTDMHTGVHRLSFDDNRVHLTLAIGDARDSLRQEIWQADSVFLDGFSPSRNPQMWSVDMFKALARCCVAGHTRLASWCVARSVQDALRQCGFEVERVPGTPPKKHNLRARYAPAWQPSQRRAGAAGALGSIAPLPEALRQQPQRHCVVIGAGIAGASVARAMAERGWSVTVLEQASGPAQGASALPVGLFAPHVSPDDAPLSRLTRAGVRCMQRTAARLLQQGVDWQPSGVLEHRIGKRSGLPPAPAAAPACAAMVSEQASHRPEEATALDPASPTPRIPSTATRLATQAERLHAGMDSGIDAAAAAASAHPVLMHTQAGWLRPAALVQALLAHPRIRLRTDCRVSAIAALEPAHPPAQSADNGTASTPHGEHESMVRWQVLGHAAEPDATPSPAIGTTAAAPSAPPQPLAQADCLVLAGGYGSLALARSVQAEAAQPPQASQTPQAPQALAHAELPERLAPPLNAVRGQVAWGLIPPSGSPERSPPGGSQPDCPDFPAWPVNGKGSLIAIPAPSGQGHLWLSGGTFEREDPLQAPTPQAQADALRHNRERIAALLPAVGPALAARLFDGGAPVQRWGAVRCTVPDRFPAYGPWLPQARAGNALLATGLGSRGLTLACLCAEILAASLHAEPLPVARHLAASLFAGRFAAARADHS